MHLRSCAVAVVTRDRPASLGRLLDALLAQSRRPEQIVIVDDGEIDRQRLDDWADRCQRAGVEFTYHRKAGPPGRSASRNIAVELASAHWVCFLDDDCEPAADFLEKLLTAAESFAPAGGVAVEGNVVPPGGPRRGDRAFAALLRLARWWGRAPLRRPIRIAPQLVSRRVLCGVCIAPRELLRIERFDETLAHGEDNEWSARLARHGRIARAADAMCVHHVDPAGRPGGFASGVRLARSYLFSQGKLFGWRGRIAARGSLLVVAIGSAGFGLIALLMLRRTGLAHLARAAGIVAAMFSPGGPRAD